MTLYTSDVLDDMGLDILGPICILQCVDAVMVLVSRGCYCSNHYRSGVARQPILHTVVMISVTCPEAIFRLSAMVFYKMRSRDYPTVA